MNSKTCLSLNLKRFLIVTTILTGMLQFSCTKDEMSVPLNTATIRFSAASYTIELNTDTALKVTLPLSLPLEEDATAVVTIGNGTADESEYTIDPALPSGTISLALAKGATEVSFNVASLDNFEGNKTLILSLTSATGGVSVANTNAKTTITLVGNAPVVPTITSSVTALDDFGSIANGSESASTSFTVAGTILTTDVTVFASDHFQVSLDNVNFTSFVQIPFADANAAPVEVFARFKPASGVNQQITGTITSSTTGVANSVVNVSGTEMGNAEIPGVLYLNENFDYGAADGELLALSGGNWAQFSGSLRPVEYHAQGLSFTGYAGSAIGGAVNSENKKGDSREDDARVFPSQNSGKLYVAQLLNFASAPAAEDFFTSFRDDKAGYFNRIYALDEGGSLKIGLRKTSTTPTAYGPATYSYGTTYLVVTKYDFSTGVGSLYVISGAIPSVEPSTPDAISDVGGGPEQLKDVIIRQNTGAPLSVNMDGIRVSNTWKTVLGLD